MSSSPKLSGSGSIQSHLSSASSRLRISSSVTGLSKEHDQDALLTPPSSSPTKIPKLSTFLRLSFMEFPQTASLRTHICHWAAISVKIVVLLYCLFSIFYGPYKVYRNRFATSGETKIIRKSSNELRLSPVSFLSDSQKLSRVMSFQPEIKSLEAGFTPRNTSHQSVTLCLWADESELFVIGDRLVRWGTHWKGPISFLVTTQDSTSSTALIRYLENLKHEPSLLDLSVHVLHIQARYETYSPNALLNLARLLASTPFVLLLPGGLSSLSSHSFGDSILTHHDNVSSTPSLIIDPSATLSFPLPELTPLLIRQDFPSWCTERFLYLQDRMSSWNECLWQLWMEADGKLAFVREVVTHEVASYSPHSDLELHISQHLVSTFRVEMCDLQVKRLAISGKHPTKKLQRRIDWVKRFCRQTTGNTFKIDKVLSLAQ